MRSHDCKEEEGEDAGGGKGMCGNESRHMRGVLRVLCSWVGEQCLVKWAARHPLGEGPLKSMKGFLWNLKGGPLLWRQGRAQCPHSSWDF